MTDGRTANKTVNGFRSCFTPRSRSSSPGGYSVAALTIDERIWKSFLANPKIEYTDTYCVARAKPIGAETDAISVVCSEADDSSRVGFEPDALSLVVTEIDISSPKIIEADRNVGETTTADNRSSIYSRMTYESREKDIAVLAKARAMLHDEVVKSTLRRNRSVSDTETLVAHSDGDRESFITGERDIANDCDKIHKVLCSLYPGYNGLFPHEQKAQDGSAPHQYVQRSEQVEHPRELVEAKPCKRSKRARYRTRTMKAIGVVVQLGKKQFRSLVKPEK